MKTGLGDPATLRKTFEFLQKTFFVVTGATLASSAAVFLLQHGCFDCTMVFWIPGTDILAAWVYPTSVLIISFFFIIYGFKFGFRAVPLMLMVFGIFDVFDKLFALYVQGLVTGTFGCGPGTVCNYADSYFWIQNALMLGGFILAGFPKFKADRYFFATIGVLAWSELGWWPNLVQWHGIFAYQFYEVALFIYVYKSTTLRSIPSRLTFK